MTRKKIRSFEDILTGTVDFYDSDAFLSNDVILSESLVNQPNDTNLREKHAYANETNVHKFLLVLLYELQSHYSLESLGQPASTIIYEINYVILATRSPKE
jgi:hypothetical protein